MTPALERLAAALADAWRNGTTIELPPPGAGVASRAEAYAVQDRLAALLGERCAGWKVGAVVPAVQALEGHDGPIPGRLFAPRTFASPARLPATRYDGHRIECEYAFRFERDAPARPGGWTRPELVAIAVLVPGLEVAGSRYASGRRATTHEAIADNGAGGAYVAGTPVAGWRDIDLGRLAIDARVDGGEAVVVYAGAERRDPVDVLVETVNALGERGIGFDAGQLLSTGSLTVPAPLHRGQTFNARFGDLQVLSVTLE